MTELVKYEEAKRLLAEAVAVDEVKSIRDKAEAMRAYAKQAKDREMEIAAAHIRFRAERRLGEMIVAQKETVGLARGAAGIGKSASAVPDVYSTQPPTLEQAGIDRKLSSRAQRMAAIEPDRFEALLERHRDEVLDGNNKVSVDLMRTSAEQDGRDRRRQLARELSDATAALPTGRRFPVIYADPPWHRKQGVTSRSYENHYTTMGWDEICALPIRDLALPDAWLFLWIPRAHMFALHPIEVEVALPDGELVNARVRVPLAYAVAKAWGFDDYSTAFIWTKTDDEHPADHGGGVVVFDQDEVLLLFKRGRGLPKPATDEKFGSNHRERSKPLGHSRKPEFYREMIGTMSGGVPVLELFARVDADHPLPEGWEAFGNQADTTTEIADVTTVAADMASVAEDSQAKADAAIAVTDGALAPAAEGVDGIASRLAGGRTPDGEGGDVASPALPPSLDPDEGEDEPFDEYLALKVVSDWCYPKRGEIVHGLALRLMARGMANRIAGLNEWRLSDAGKLRLQQYEDEARAARESNCKNDCDTAVSRETLNALRAVDAGGPIDAETLQRLRADKLVTGVRTVKLTKDGRIRMDELAGYIAERERLAALPTDLDELVALYRAALDRVHAAMLAGEDDAIDEHLAMLALLQERANGNTSFGMATSESPAERLRAETMAPIGQEPLWLQRGVFRVEIDGAPYLVTHNEHGDFAAYAVDPSKPCISETGFRSYVAADTLGFGRTVAQHAEALIRADMEFAEDHMAGKRKVRKTALPLPEHVYRMPAPGHGYRPQRVQNEVARKALAQPDLFARVPVAASPSASGVQTRMPIDDEEIELRDVLAAYARGEDPPLMHVTVLRELTRDLIGRGWLDFDPDAECPMQVTPEGHAWLATLVDPVSHPAAKDHAV